MTGGERLLRTVQKCVQLLPHGSGFLFCRPNLREPALLDHAQGSFETPRQRGRPNASIQRLPSVRQVRIVDGCARSELLGFDDQRFDAGKRLELPRPSLDALFRLIEPGRRGIRVLLTLCVQRGNLAAQDIQFARRGGRLRPTEPFAEPVLEVRTRPLLCVFPIEALLERLAGRFAAREAQRVVVEVQSLASGD